MQVDSTQTCADDNETLLLTSVSCNTFQKRLARRFWGEFHVKTKQVIKSFSFFHFQNIQITIARLNSNICHQTTTAFWLFLFKTKTENITFPHYKTRFKLLLCCFFPLYCIIEALEFGQSIILRILHQRPLIVLAVVNLGSRLTSGKEK